MTKNITTVTTQWMRLAVAAQYMGISAWKLRRLIKQGLIHATQDNEHSPFLVSMDEIKAYMKKHPVEKTA